MIPENDDIPSTECFDVFQSAGIVFICTLIGGVFGLAVGFLLGNYVPNYYRSVFANGDHPNFDPLAVGIGQGLTQGLGLGCVVGLALIGLLYLSRSRLQKSQMNYTEN